MVPRLLHFWHGLRSSLWALPVLMVLVGACAAILAVHFPIRQGKDPAWFLYSGNAQEAPQFLSDLVTAMITMATLAVSITMVVLALATQQLGPRLIRSFMADRRRQLTLGLFVATVVYLLLVLRSTYGGANNVPNLAVTGGTTLVLLCLIALLVFVHHLARSIIADTIVDRVGSADIERLLTARDRSSSRSQTLHVWERGAPLNISDGGYIQAIDHGGIVDIAKEADAVAELSINVGDHIIPGCIFAWIAPRKAANEALRNKEGCLVLSGERASIQDLETSIRQLVEVALRALSPSVTIRFPRWR